MSCSFATAAVIGGFGGTDISSVNNGDYVDSAKDAAAAKDPRVPSEIHSTGP